jgi:hypothetical protein
MANVDGEWLPCYVRMDDGKIVRWLTLDNNKRQQLPAGRRLGEPAAASSSGRTASS